MNRFETQHGDLSPGREGDHGLLEPADPALVDRESGAASTRSRRPIGGGALLFGVVMIGAFASLWSMRAIGRASADSGAPTEAGRLVESYLNERTKSQTQPTAADLATAPLPIGDMEELQVAREKLQRDPFASPWRSAVVAAVEQTADMTAAAATPLPESRLAEWEALVDAGARDFVVESILLAPNPAMSIVSMNGAVFRVGESVMFADHAIRYEIKAVDATSVTLAAFNDEFSRERVVRLAVRDRH